MRLGSPLYANYEFAASHAPLKLNLDLQIPPGTGTERHKATGSFLPHWGRRAEGIGGKRVADPPAYTGSPLRLS